MPSVLRFLAAVGLLFAGLGVSAAPAAAASGENWTLRTAEEKPWQSITYGNGLFVAVTSGDVMTSPDGVNWTYQLAPEANGWRSVTYGNGLFVAVALDGIQRVMTSPDGVTWTLRTAPAASWYAVTFGGGLFVAVGDSVVMTSPDGITWTQRSPSTATPWNAVTYGGASSSLWAGWEAVP